MGEWGECSIPIVQFFLNLHPLVIYLNNGFFPLQSLLFLIRYQQGKLSTVQILAQAKMIGQSYLN